MKQILSLLLLCTILTACNKLDLPKDTPECIEDKIKDISEEDVWSTPAIIYSYQFDGQTVYYFPSRCCDATSYVYSEDCYHLCSPGGGLSGDGDNLCPDFFDNATEATIIWEDDRD
ncbi:MAG: hypothetical protein HRT71_18410 [Flavobacteriales bacterium]|nr:hypothetical protein [Flavobacteriales bacterium]